MGIKKESALIKKMHHYSQGKVHKQAHKGIPENCYEEEQGRDGFYGPVSHLVRKAPSPRWKDIKGSLKPKMYDLNHLDSNSQGWQRILYNSFVQTFYVKQKVSRNPKKGFRNADGDMLYFCHKGRGEVLTEYGLLKFSKGDYIVLPKCLVHTFLLEEDSEFFVIESHCGYFREPERGLLGQHALYDIEVLQKPNLELQEKRKKELNLSICEIDVKKSSEHTSFLYDNDIYDVMAWKGNFFPFLLNIKNIMPVMSHRAHLPPSVHTTFFTSQFVVCSFVPRPLEMDSDSLKVPFYHQNIDYDEVIFYHDGDFFSRDNLKSGMMSFHPSGFPHGPHPKAFRSVKEKTKTDEYAVMLDSAKPLKEDKGLLSVELKDYWKSWQIKNK